MSTAVVILLKNYLLILRTEPYLFIDCGMEDILKRCIVEPTADGSPTLYQPDLDEHYHSVKGALTESLHVYLDMGWRYFAGEKVKVFEVGFGTGLNAALTAQAADCEGKATEYISVELYPLSSPLTSYLEGFLEADLLPYYRKVNDAEWDCPTVLHDRFVLDKRLDNILTMKIPEGLNVVYFDAFAPEKQPEIWTESVFRRIFASLSHGGVLTTYCAKGCVRRMLEEIGFKIERLPGPQGGKREILRGIKE